jgi:hypothetical protein
MENEKYKTVNKTQVFRFRGSDKSSLEDKHMFGRKKIE